MIDIEVHGMDEILKKFNKLPEKLQDGIIQSGVRAGAKMLAEEAKKNIPVKYGALRDSIGVKKASRPKINKKTLLIYKVSPMRKAITRKFTTASGQKWSIKGEVDGWYGHFIEFGTYAKLDHPLKNKIYGKRKKRRNKMVAAGVGIRPVAFLRKAFHAKGKETIRVTRKYIENRIDKEIAKL